MRMIGECPTAAAVRDQDVPEEKESDRQRESRQILERVSRETDSSGFANLGSAVEAVRRRVEAGTPPEVDPIEYWGTRIGRGLGFLITGVIVLWLVAYLLGGF